jgi:hypothetical protein
MAPRKNPPAVEPADFSRTPGVSKDAQAQEADTPLVLSVPGPRDALVDPHPDDIVPDMEEKGYHAGLVRQPAAVLVEGGQVVGFESKGGQSKFEAGSLQAMKAAHNERDANRDDDAAPSPPVTEDEANRNRGHENDAS